MPRGGVANTLCIVIVASEDKQKILLSQDVGHFSLIRAMHLADLITELNGMCYTCLPRKDKGGKERMGCCNALLPVSACLLTGQDGGWIYFGTLTAKG